MVKSIQTQLKILGLYRGKVDGISGSKTVSAVKKFQRLHPPLVVDGIAGKATLAMLVQKPIANRDSYSQTDIISMYGVPGKELDKVTLPYKMKLAWSTDTTIKRFSCHRKIKSNLENIFEQTLDYYGHGEIIRLGLDLFGGCFNIRSIRGGVKLSTHSWALAVDLDPANNQLTWDSSKARFATPQYDEFWRIVADNGGISYGKTKDFDYMHIQFVKT